MKWRIYLDGKPTDSWVEAPDEESARFVALAAAQTGTIRGEPSVRPFDRRPRHSRLVRAIRAVIARPMRRAALAGLGALLLVTVTLALRSTGTTVDGAGNATPAWPAGLDTLMSLSEVRAHVDACGSRGRVAGPVRGVPRSSDSRTRGQQPVSQSNEESASDMCGGVIYVWSPLMPLSRQGIADVAAATQALDVDLSVLDASDLYARLDSMKQPSAVSVGDQPLGSEEALVMEMVAAGATITTQPLSFIVMVRFSAAPSWATRRRTRIEA